MSSDTKKQLQEVEQLIIHGKFQEALNLIEAIAKKNGLSKEEELTCKVLKSEVMNQLGEGPAALQLAEEVLTASEGLDDSLLQLDALIQQSIALWRFFRRFEESSAITEKAEQLLQSLPKLPPKVLAQRKALLLYNKGIYPYIKGDYDQALEYQQQSSNFAEESGNKQLIAYMQTSLGIIYLYKGNYDLAEKYFEKSLETAETIQNKQEIARAFRLMGVLYYNKREFNRALSFSQKSVAFAEESGSKRDLPWIYSNMGDVYLDLFELDRALEWNLKAFALREEDPFKQEFLTGIGYLYHLKGAFSQAIDYYQKALKICEEIQDRRALPWALYNLILISIELKNLSQAQEYLERLEQISIETGFKRIGRFYRFASIMLLKASGNIGDLAEATELLKASLKEEDLPSGWRLHALYALLEIRIKELKISSNENTIAEVQKQAIRLEVEAKEQQRRWLLANVYRLQSQLALVELDAKKAIELLQKAQAIAEEINVELLKKSIKEDQEKIEQQLTMLIKLQEQNAPLSETVKLVSLEETVQNIKQETVLKERDEETGEIIDYRKLFTLRI